MSGHTRLEITRILDHGVKKWQAKTWCDEQSGDTQGHVTVSMSKDTAVRLLQERVDRCAENRMSK